MRLNLSRMCHRFVSVTVSAALLAAPLSPALAAEPGGKGVIKGSLVDANGAPLQGYKVIVTDANGVVYQSPVTGADGKYEIPDLPSGTYTYEILDPEGQIVPTKVPPVVLESGVSLTQPIAIVPKPPNKKGAAIAWTAGGLVAVALAISAANGDDDDDDDDDGMTASTP